MAVKSEAMQALIKERDRLESSIAGYIEFLNSPGNPGLTGSLNDAEGFPRGDLDLYAIRDARNKIACYRNDHTEVMKKIEQELFSLHEKTHVAVPRTKDNSKANETGEGLGLAAGPPFGAIDQVAPNGPAFEAGLQVDDKIKRFGAVSLLKFEGVANCFAALPTQVKEDEPVQLVISRNVDGEEKEMNLTLTPKKWDGPKLLGCHLVPMNV